MPSQIHLLKTKRFLPLFITQFFGAFNDNAFKNAFLIWFTYDVSVTSGLNAPMIVTLAAGLFVLPFLLFSATAGQLADKYEKSWLVQKIKLSEVFLMLLCAFFFYIGSVYGLLVVLFLMGVQSTFFGPIKYSLLPEHLKDNELISGNGLIESSTFLSILFGTIFGGLIIRTTYGVELLSFSIIAFSIIGWLSSLSIPNSPVGDKKLKIGWNIITVTKNIISYARIEPTVWLSIIGISWFWLIGATFLTQFSTYTKIILKSNEEIVTTLLSSFSIGVGIGSLLCNKLLKGKIDGRLVPWGILGITFGIAFLVLSSHLYLKHLPLGPSPLLGLVDFLNLNVYSLLILASLFIISLCTGIYIVPLYAIIQHRSKDKYLSRVIAANNVMNSLFMVLSSLFALILFSLNFSVLDLFLTLCILNIPLFYFIRNVAIKRVNTS
jgi:acyl-[acyl-carrier-protein]-phospholipid O-acyltransferase / long-chain-fatty-acid--[acyl-carrier-protein] ligase